MFAAAAMSLSSVSVLTNALRLKRFRPEQLYAATEQTAPIRASEGTAPTPVESVSAERERNEVMEHITINVEGMSCEHCVKAVTDAASALPSVTGVAVDLAAGTAALDYDPEQVTEAEIKEAIEDQGYDVA
jgi:copper chaperone